MKSSPHHGTAPAFPPACPYERRRRAENGWTRAPNRRPRSRSIAFTLIELLAVIVLMMIVIILAISAVHRFGEELRLSETIRMINTQCQLARQEALAKGHITEVRFLLRDGEWSAFQTVVYRAGGTVRPISRLEVFPSGIVLEPSPGASPLFAALHGGTMDTPQYQTLEWRGLRFMPSGEAIGLSGQPLDPLSSYLSLVHRGNLDPARPPGGGMPANYATLKIAPATSQMVVYRP